MTLCHCLECWMQYKTGKVGFTGGTGKESACNAGDLALIPGSGRSPGGGHGNPLQYSRLEDSMHRGAWRAAVHGVAKSRIRLRLHFHFSLSCIGEGNGNPLQCSCLENPRDGGAWWAALHCVAQSRTRLKRLSSSSSSSPLRKGQLVSCFFLIPWHF